MNEIRIWKSIFLLFFRTLASLFRPSAWRGHEITQAIVQGGIRSIPIVTLSTAFAGVVVTQQIAWHMNLALHDVSMIPGFTGQFIFRELGIAIPALLLVSKVGASITAEIGTMKVTDQIDALKLLRIDPVEYLVFPRFIAGIVSSTSLTLLAVAVTLGCSALVGILGYNFGVLEFLNGMKHFIGIADVACALVKGITFGSMIPIVSCAYGFHCQGGAQGGGKRITVQWS
jgi:phospholipid/cholesterol/gamma-HCH transport system permease protein